MCVVFVQSHVSVLAQSLGASVQTDVMTQKIQIRFSLPGSQELPGVSLLLALVGEQHFHCKCLAATNVTLLMYSIPSESCHFHFSTERTLLKEKQSPPQQQVFHAVATVVKIAFLVHFICFSA